MQDYLNIIEKQLTRAKKEPKKANISVFQNKSNNADLEESPKSPKSLSLFKSLIALVSLIAFKHSSLKKLKSQVTNEKDETQHRKSVVKRQYFQKSI